MMLLEIEKKKRKERARGSRVRGVRLLVCWEWVEFFPLSCSVFHGGGRGLKILFEKGGRSGS